MASDTAKAVAHEIIKKVGKGRINKKEIILKNGYAKSVADNPKKVTETKSYKSVISPFQKRLIAHRDKIMFAMDGKDLTKEQYKTLSDALAKVNHDLQIIGGGITEAVKLSWE